MTKPKFKVVNQGTIIVEKDGRIYLILMPDGLVEKSSTKKEVSEKINKWLDFDLVNREIQVGASQIEWGPEILKPKELS